MKLRDARTELRALGFVRRPGKGSHEVWTDPASPQRRVVLYGRGGEDIHHYQAVRVRKFKRGAMSDQQRKGVQDDTTL